MAETNTNAQILPDLDAYFRNQGKPAGYQPEDWEIDLAISILKPVTKELMMRQFAPKEGAEKLGTRTNEVTKDVLRTIEYPDGTFKPYETPMIQTTEGYQELVAPGTTRSITNIDTGQIPKGYVAAGSGWGVGQQLTVGANNDAARAAAAQQGQAAPAQKPFTMRTAEGQTLTFSNAYDIRAALDRGELTIPEADLAIKKSGFQIPR